MPGVLRPPGTLSPAERGSLWAGVALVPGKLALGHGDVQAPPLSFLKVPLL